MNARYVRTWFTFGIYFRCWLLQRTSNECVLCAYRVARSRFTIGTLAHIYTHRGCVDASDDNFVRHREPFQWCELEEVGDVDKRPAHSLTHSLTHRQSSVCTVNCDSKSIPLSFARNFHLR